MFKRLGRFIDPYIVLMFVTVIVASILPARGSGAVVAGFAADAGIVFLFFLYGTRLSLRAAWDGLRQWRLHVAVLLSTFALFPVLGLAIKAGLPPSFPAGLGAGLIFLCVLPSTVQSSIAFTSIARGNVAAALCAASASNIIGVVLTPLLLGWLIHAQGAHLSFGVFRDIILQLLVPFFTGQAVRPWVSRWIADHKQILSYADRGSILLIIYVAFSKGMVAHIWSRIGAVDLLILFVALSVLLASALVITRLIARYGLKLSTEDEIVLQFCGSKKSLASGLPMASILFAGAQLSVIVIPLMIFHQLQLVVCAFLARHYGARRDTAAPSESPAKGGLENELAA